MSSKNNVALLVLFAAAIVGSTAQTTYGVLDSRGWTITGNASDYTNWAAGKSFTVGDTLLFNYTTGSHDVAEVSKAAFDSCNTTDPISIQTTGPTSLRLATAGEHYYICTFPGHCSRGQQKLAITVSTTSGSAPAPAPGSPPPPPTPTSSPAPATTPPASSPAPASTSTPPSAAPGPGPAPATSPAAPTPAPSRAPVTYIVGGTTGWNVFPNASTFYQTWASNKTFLVGDVLLFNFTEGKHSVAEVTKSAYDSCNTSSTLSLLSTPPVRVTLATTGTHYYTCNVTGHCSYGQKLAITVTGSATAANPSGAPSPSTTIGTPSPSTSSTPGTTAPPPGSSATSLRVTALSAAVVSVALALMY